MHRVVVAVVSLALLVCACSPDASGAGAGIVLTEIASPFDRPVSLASAPGDATRLFVVEQSGRIRIVKGRMILREPFLDLSGSVSCCGERGLLGLAFHPSYQGNGLFFVNYTDTTGTTVVARFRVGANPDVADPASRSVVLTIAQPYANHNGGALQFGPDGYLYIGTGDGGSGGDPDDRAQNPADLLGKMLRIDVDVPSGYVVPPTNPIVANRRSEIWATGLRNPWRFSFDMASGDLFIADVGQNKWEEINHQPASSRGGENYGWRRMEGSHCYIPSTKCDDGTLVKPVIEYSHENGCSVTGGYIHRGTSSSLYGSFLYGDFCSGVISAARRDASGTWSSRPLLNAGFPITSFGQDNAGEVYVVNYSGIVYRIDDPVVRRRPARAGR